MWRLAESGLEIIDSARTRQVLRLHARFLSKNSTKRKFEAMGYEVCQVGTVERRPTAANRFHLLSSRSVRRYFNAHLRSKSEPGRRERTSFGRCVLQPGAATHAAPAALSTKLFTGQAPVPGATRHAAGCLYPSTAVHLAPPARL